MTEYQIQPNTRQCSVTGRPLQSGERFYTALLEEGDHFLRKDFSLEAWQGPPPGAFSFWTGRVRPPRITRSRVSTTTCLKSAFIDWRGRPIRAVLIFDTSWLCC